MAYLEVRKSGRLIERQPVDDGRACKGCRIRVGSSEVKLTLGESKRIGDYEIEMREGTVPCPGGKAAEIPKGVPDSFPAISATEPSQAPGRDAGVQPTNESLFPVVEGYRIIGSLGRGGMGVVWRALQLGTKREVALKFLARDRFASKTSRARFEREVSLAAKLTHPNIATVYDSGLYRGGFYYAMELVDGIHMDQYVRQNELAQPQILKLMERVCDAIAYAHGKGIIHRDLKPSNILVTTDGQPHVVDFGLAKAYLEKPGDLTISIEGPIAGTLVYMSPEQAAGWADRVDKRSDVYSLGVILYYLLTGRLPHDVSGSHYEVLRRIVETDVQSPREASTAIGSALEALLLKALHHDPDRRYADAGELARDIHSYVSGEPLDARPLTGIDLIRSRLSKWRSGSTPRGVVPRRRVPPGPMLHDDKAHVRLSLGSPTFAAEVTIWEGRTSFAYFLLWCLWDSVRIGLWGFFLSNNSVFFQILTETVPATIPESRPYLGSPHLRQSYLAYVFLLMLLLAVWKAVRRVLEYLNVYYVFTTQRFKVREGILSHDFLQAELFRIKDFRIIRTFWGWLLGYAHIQLVSTDRLITERKGGNLLWKGIPDGVKIAEEIRLAAQVARSQAGLMAIQE